MTKHGGGGLDRAVYGNHIFGLLKQDTEEAYQKELDEKKNMWSEAFVTYFESNLAKRLTHYARWEIGDKIELNDNGITTNMSEGFNWFIKDLTRWRESIIDCTVLCFRLLPDFYR